MNLRNDLEAFKDLEYLRGFRRTLEQDLNVSPVIHWYHFDIHAQLPQAAIPITILGSSLEAIARVRFQGIYVWETEQETMDCSTSCVFSNILFQVASTHCFFK